MDIKLYKSPVKAIKLILVCSIFVMGGLYAWIYLGLSIWLTILLFGPFGLGYPIGLFHLLDRRPQIIINEIGVFDRTTYKDFINWDIIQGSYSIDLGLRFVVLKVNEKYLSSIKKRKFAMSLTNWVDFGPEQLSISVGQIAIDGVKLAEFILAMAKESPEDRKEKFKRKLL
jgi:hypothetical protein